MATSLFFLLFYSILPKRVGDRPSAWQFFARPRLSSWRSLLWFCGVRVFAIAAYLLPALGMVNLPLLYGVAMGSQLANGMAMTALFTVMMDRSALTTPGTDFTLQTSLIYIITTFM